MISDLGSSSLAIVILRLTDFANKSNQEVGVKVWSFKIRSFKVNDFPFFLGSVNSSPSPVLSSPPSPSPYGTYFTEP